MERAHVLVRLRDGDDERQSGAASPETKPLQSGVCRTSATTVRLEHSDLSPGVASISFEQVFDQHNRNAEIFQHASLAAGVARVADGHALTLVATGASQSGKSFTMHGDEQDEKGLIELAIAHIFSVATSESQILFAAACTTKHLFVDAISGQQQIERNPVDGTVDGPFLSIAKRVANVDEATLAYRTALQRSHELDENKMTSDFVCVLFVESRATSSGNVHRGRLVCIDIHGHGIIEPATATTSGLLLNQDRRPRKPSLFVDTQFPVREPLTQWCGPFLGNDAVSFIIVTIHKAAHKQQQAIQSLLYACKAKEITGFSTVRHVNGFTECRAAVFDSSSTLPISNSEDDDDGDEDDESELMFLGSPVSSASSSGSICSRRAATTQQSASDLLSERLRQAYHTVKNASTSKRASPPVSVCEPVGEPADSTDPSSGVSMQTLHSRADAILNSLHQPNNNNNPNPNPESLATMTLLEKLDTIQVVYQSADKSLQHEASVKQKCVERISKLSQTMSFQVVEHEKQLKAKDAETQALRSQLEQMQTKYDEAERTLEKLQTQVTEAMKQATLARAKSPVRVPLKQQQSNERVLLQQFSARLETAMLEAKSVVDLKDAIIRDLETRLAQLQATLASNTDETMRWEHQATQFVMERQKWDEEREALQTELSRCRTDHEQDQSRWESEAATARKQLLEEWETKIETLRRGMDDAGERARQQHADQISSLGATIRGLEDQNQQRDDELRRALIRCVAADAARCSVVNHVAQLETELSHVRAKLGKEKKKLEKKLRILMTERKQLLDDHSKLESDMACDVQRLNLELAAVRAELSSRDEELQRREQLLSQLEARASNANQQCVVHKEQIAVLQDCVAQLESDKQALDHELHERTYSLEQRGARQLVEKETKLSIEYEHKLRDTMERHAAELLQRDLELSRLRSSRRAQLLPLTQVSSTQSSSSSVGTSSCDDQAPQQHDLDQLERMLDNHNDHPNPQQCQDSRRRPGSCRDDKLTRQKHKIAALRQQVVTLTQALAIANEQETLAKQAVEQQHAQYQRMMYAQDELLTQINQAKQENWALSWALHVTELRQQQRHQQQGVSTTEGVGASSLSLSSSSCSSTVA